MTPDRAASTREQRAQRMLRRVVGASADVIYVYHVAWHRIAFFGHRVREVLGFTAARSQRMRFAAFEALVHPADLAGLHLHLAAIGQAADGDILSQELRIKGTDGRYRWLRCRATVLARTDTGAVAKVVGVVTNIDETKKRASRGLAEIAERERAEREAARSRQLLQSSLDALTTQIAILDAAGAIVATNKAWVAQAAAHGLPAGVGSSYLGICAGLRDGEEAERICRGLGAVLAGERNTARFAYSAEVAGGRRWFQLSAARFEWDGDSRVIVANEDLTDVSQAREALSELSGRLSSLREEERQRIAQELHDSTAQHLVAATLNLMTLKAKAVAYPGVRQLLQNVESSLEEATRELRVFTYLLHPLTLENDGLERTLRTYLEGFGRRTCLEVQFSVAGRVEELPFPLHCALLRIIQEALANVHRHACASHVSIGLTMSPGVLRLVIADDGRGMRGQVGNGVDRTGVGIPGMRARLREFGGTLEIHSGPRGTTLSAIVPLGAAVPWACSRERAAAPLAAAYDSTSQRT
jgi:signal transduction histidine kinase